MDADTGARLLAAIDATWPPEETVRRAGWVLRRGGGGGKRVSAASLAGTPGAKPVPEPTPPAAALGQPPSPLRREADAGLAGLPDIAVAAAAMAAWGQPPLFRIAPGEAPGEAALDAALAAAGYAVIDPVAVYAAPVGALADDADETARVVRVTARLALAEEIWAAGGIGPGRLAVMARAPVPRVTLLVRLGDRPAGVGFVACDGEVAMVHAVEVPAGFRRRGLGTQLLRGAANWAAEQGAAVLALAVTETNAGARALYEGLGMVPAARYHYRILSA